MISLDKCNWICNNVVGDISAIVCVSSKTKGVNVKVFKMITRMNGGKALVKHPSCRCKCKFHSATCNSNQKWNNERCQWDYKNYQTCKESCSWNPSTCICENGKI